MTPSIGSGEIDVILDQPAANDDEEAEVVPELPADAISRVGDLWQMDKHRLLCGSSLETAVWNQLMAGATAAMSLNDPPYNVAVNGHVSGSKRYAEFAMASGEMTREELQAFNAGYLRNIAVHLKDGGIAPGYVDVGVGRRNYTPGKPKGSRSTVAQSTRGHIAAVIEQSGCHVRALVPCQSPARSWADCHDITERQRHSSYTTARPKRERKRDLCRI